MTIFSFLRQVETAALAISRAAEVFEKNVQILKDEAKWRHKSDLGAATTESCIINIILFILRSNKYIMLKLFECDIQ